MRKHSKGHLAKFEAVFKRYLDDYMIERDIERVKELLSEDFCGYGTGLDENFYCKKRGMEIFQRDISSSPLPLDYTLHHYEIKLLDQFHAIILTEMDLKTKNMDQEMKLNNLRMMMLLHEEEGIVKISGIHISFPTEVHGEDESYPLKELEERTKVLNRMVEEKTISLQKAITELKQSQEALRKSEARFRNLVDTTPDYIYSLDEESRHTAVNQSICRDLGLKEEEIIGKNHIELGFPEEICNIWKNLHRRVFSQQKVVREETFSPMPDGTIHTYEVILTPMFDEDGKVNGIHGISRDITESKKAKRDIKNLVENAPDMIVRFNTRLEHIYCNQAVEDCLGISVKNVLGKTFADLATYLGRQGNDLYEMMTDTLKECMKTRKEQYVELHFLLDGEDTYFSTRVVPEFTDAGHIESLLAVTRDITVKKLAEERLKASERQLDMFFSQSLYGFYMCMLDEPVEWNDTIDKDKVLEYVLDHQRMTRANQAMLHQYGATEEEFIGITVRELFQHDLDHAREIWRGLFHRGNWHVETYEQKMDKTPIVIDGNYICFYDNEGRITGHFGVQVDISERKKMEEKIRYQHEFQKVVANISFRFINPQSSSLDEAIHNTLYQIGDFFQVDRSSLIQFSSNDTNFAITHEWCREGIKPQKERIQNQSVDDFPWMIHGIRSRDYFFVPDVNTIAYEKEKDELKRQGIQSLLCIPIKVQERTVGFIGMDSVSKKMIWTDEEVILLKVISEIISSAFSKHQMEQELIQRNQEVEHLNQHLNQEIEKAHLIHNNILPKELPSINGVSFAAFYQPAETLGGDFYDVIHVDNKLVIYLSDISGHGLDGGIINFFVKEAIDSYIALKPESLTPKNILKHLERQFRQKKQPAELLISIFLSVFDLETMELTYTGAGFQDTPFVKQGNGEEGKLSVTGFFINSIFPIDKNSFQEKTISLTAGSTIFFNTDGLTEQGEPGAFYQDRLPQVFYAKAHLRPEKIAQALLHDFRSFNHGSLQGNDDITFLILQVKPKNRRYKLELATDFHELEDLKKKAAGFFPDVEETQVLISCLYELTANAMEHGNQMDPTKRVIMELVVFDDYMQISVEDEGDGFTWREKVEKPLELEGHTDRGRGVAMTGILCDSLSYNDKGNKATCVVNYSKGGRACR